MKIKEAKLRRIIREEHQRLQETGGKESWNLMERLKNMLGADTLLEELMRAMDEREAMENLEHVAQMHDLEYHERGEY